MNSFNDFFKPIDLSQYGKYLTSEVKPYKKEEPEDPWKKVIGYQPQYTKSKTEESTQKSEQSTQTSTTPDSGFSFAQWISNQNTQAETPVKGKITFADGVTKDKLHKSLQDMLDLAEQEGIDLYITSGYREGAKTAQGNDSRHGKGYAIDIRPTDLDKVKKSKRFLQYLKDNKIDWYDETDDKTLATTGGTGKHYHVSHRWNNLLENIPIINFT